MRSILIALMLFVLANPVLAQKRLALLIGNQDYGINSLDLKNPHNDVAAVGKALKKVGFKVRIVKDAGFGKLQKEINRYAKRLRAAGKDAVGFFYYSGHGALNEQDRFNYLIPTDVETVDSNDLWDGSVRLKRIVDDLKDKASNAVHFVVFDACRNELKLASKGSKSLRQSKGFKPLRERVRGMLIAYATAEGEIASDVGAKVGPYAEALAEWITKPGVEAVNMFREVQVSVFNNIGQEPWYTHGALKRVYLAGKPQANTSGRPLRLVDVAWEKLKASKDEIALKAFADRHKGTVYAELALGRIAMNRLERQNKIRERAKRKDKAKSQASSGTLGCFANVVRLATGTSVCISPGSGRSFKDCPTCPEMVVVPAGKFMMGSPASEPERADNEDQVPVSIAKPFSVGKFEITRGQFAAFVKATGHSVGNECWPYDNSDGTTRVSRSFRKPGFSQNDNHPVVCVNWKDAQAYVKWLNTKLGLSGRRRYRLPSDAEWEYVTRAGTTTPFWWGSSITPNQANYDGIADPYKGGGRKGKDRQKTVPVGSFKANPWGLYDVHGNVWEWVQDCYNESNSGNPGNGAARTTGDCSLRIIRGGTWYGIPQSLRSATRSRFDPDKRYFNFGFRVVRMLGR